MKNTGLNLAFQLIFAEIVSKNIPETDVFTYSAERLRQIGAEMRRLGHVNFLSFLFFMFYLEFRMRDDS